MSRKRIVMSEDSTAILLPREVIDELGVLEGDEVDVSVADGALIMRPLDDRVGNIDRATRAVFDRRGPAYKKLAEGVE